MEVDKTERKSTKQFRHISRFRLLGSHERESEKLVGRAALIFREEELPQHATINLEEHPPFPRI